MTSPSSAPPVARFTSPAEMAAAIPVLTGFVPRESVVVVSLRAPRKRIGLTMRFDLPPEEYADVLAAEVAGRLQHDGAIAALVVVYTDREDVGGERAGQVLVDAIEGAGAAPLTEALLVRGGRWWSYLCTAESCCPGEGTPVDAASSPALELLTAESTLKGRAVLASRDDLVRSIAPPQLLAGVAAEQRLDAAAEVFVAAGDSPATRAAAVQAAARLLDADGGATLDPAAVAALGIALHAKPVRDEIATWALDRPDDLLALLIRVARQVVPPYDAPICTLLAWVAYAQGNGALANVALDRALDTDPAYSMAALLRQSIDAQIPPEEVRDILRHTKEVLGGSTRPRRRRRR
jgi:hypothetical protein